jgi:hypothetical protein
LGTTAPGAAFACLTFFILCLAGFTVVPATVEATTDGVATVALGAAGACAKDAAATLDNTTVANKILKFFMVYLTKEATVASAPTVLSEPND